MSRASKLISLAAIAFAVMSCGGSEQPVQMAKVDGVIEGAPASEVVIGKLDVNQLVVLDTLTTDQDGKFQYELEVKKGNPEFVYVYFDGIKVASLLLEADDEVAVNVPVEGATSIEGSEESAKLMQLELEHAAMSAVFADYAAQLENASESQYDKVVRQMTENYREYNRKSIKYVMENSHSLTSIPVLYRTLGDLPVFAMSTDAVMFSSIADSLATVYPESKFVKSLRADADARMAELELMRRIELAEEVGYLDIALPGLDGSVKKLSEVDSKVVLLYFWTSSRANQNNFNIEVLKKLYNDYHKKGFDIYQVSLDVDKVHWATTVMGQNLPWTNVCDIRGAASEYATLYNLQMLPAAFVISDGELVDGQFVDEASFRKLLDKLLK